MPSSLVILIIDEIICKMYLRYNGSHYLLTDPSWLSVWQLELSKYMISIHLKSITEYLYYVGHWDGAGENMNTYHEKRAQSS